MSFEGKTAVVTGATRGIGAAIADLLESSGCFVIRTGTKSTAADDNPNSCVMQLDLVDPGSVDRFCDDVFGLESLDILVNNAGINIVAPIDELDPADFARVVAINLTGVMSVTRSAARVMKRTGKGGRILNVSSIYGVVAQAGRDSYCASKTGLIGLTRAAALDLAPDGILVNAICPGPTHTELTASILTPEAADALAAQVPLGRFAQVEEMATAAAFLVSERNTFMTGQALLVDGGYTTR